MAGDPADAAYLLLGHIARGLTGRGHRLTYVAQRDLGFDVCTGDLNDPIDARHGWSGSWWFDLASRATWRLQRLVGVPYLNVFSNLRLYDACLRCLPGHDVVYERNGLYRGGIAWACARLKLPYVLFVDADEILEHDYMGRPLTGMLRRRAQKIFRFNLARADCVVCVSEASRENLMGVWSVRPDKIAVLPNAVDVHRFRPCPTERVSRRAALGIDRSPVVLFVGSFYEWHDVATLVEAFARVRTSHREAYLLLVGDGTTRPALERRAAALGLSDSVTFTGLVPHADIPSLVNAADVAVVPYRPMQQPLWLSPLKLYEYMASGTAIVASAVGQILQVANDGVNALLVPPGDVAAMASAIERLIDDDGLRAKLGAQARRDAEDHHSWEHYLGRLECLFEAAITRHRGGHG